MKLVPVAAFLFLFSGIVDAQPTPRVINGGVLNGKAVSLPKPEYPESAKAAGLGGVVEVKVVIDEAGSVVSAVASAEPRKVRRSTHNPDEGVEEVPAADPILRDAAERAALEAKFSPTFVNGASIRVQGTLVYRFVSGNEGGSIVKDEPATGRTPSGGVLNGKAISLPKPPYPPAAAAVRAQGAVTVSVTLDEDGNVIAASAVSGHPLLRAAAVEAARGAKFSPTLLEGTPVKVTGVLVYNFIAPTAND